MARALVGVVAENVAQLRGRLHARRAQFDLVDARRRDRLQAVEPEAAGERRADLGGVGLARTLAFEPPAPELQTLSHLWILPREPDVAAAALRCRE